MNKQLYRSKRNKVIGGVCGGIAEYFDTDPTIVRLICVLLFFSGGIGLWAYIIGMIIIPESPDSFINEEEYGQNYHDNYNSENYYENSNRTYTNTNMENNEKSRKTLGIVLIGIGIFIFAKRFIDWFDFVTLGGIVLVLAGIYIIFVGGKNKGEKR